MIRNMRRIMGIDYGTRRVGVALSDPLRTISQGVATLKNDSTVIERLCKIIDERDVECVVVGMPYGPDGGKGTKAIEVEEFIQRLRFATSADIDTWDESYSSVNARQIFIAGGMKRKQRQQKARVDEMAARLMLQEYLDNHSSK
jgi:putative holliday junction resolvase